MDETREGEKLKPCPVSDQHKPFQVKDNICGHQVVCCIGSFPFDEWQKGIELEVGIDQANGKDFTAKWIYAPSDWFDKEIAQARSEGRREVLESEAWGIIGEALKRNNQWHVENDDAGGYPDSWLEELNQKAIAAFDAMKDGESNG